MDNKLIASMREQMGPSEEAQRALRERLTQEQPAKKKARMWKYAAAAACALLMLSAYPIYRTLTPKPHGYVTVDGSNADITKKMAQELTDTGKEDGNQEETHTGELIDEPTTDIPVQPGADAYQLLMAHFGADLPDWYGGAYISKGGTLMVLLVSDKDRGDKTLELEVIEAVGKDAPVAFGGVKYSYNQLSRLNQAIGELLDGSGLFASWGIYETSNNIVLDFFKLPPEELLAGLARIDPDGDAILVRVVEGGSAVTDEQRKGPPPKDTVDEEDSGEIDAVHRLPGGAYVSDEEEDLIADEPFVNDIVELPQSKQPSVVENAHDSDKP